MVSTTRTGFLVWGLPLRMPETSRATSMATEGQAGPLRSEDPRLIFSWGTRCVPNVPIRMIPVCLCRPECGYGGDRQTLVSVAVCFCSAPVFTYCCSPSRGGGAQFETQRVGLPLVTFEHFSKTISSGLSMKSCATPSRRNGRAQLFSKRRMQQTVLL